MLCAEALFLEGILAGPVFCAWEGGIAVEGGVEAFAVVLVAGLVCGLELWWLSLIMLMVLLKSGSVGATLICCNRWMA